MRQKSEIQKELHSIGKIRQMTRAMQLISAVKVRRARTALSAAFPFFVSCAESMAVLQQQSPEIATPLMNLRHKPKGADWHQAFYVFTGDQGMAGAYNINVLNEAEDCIRHHALERTQAGYHVRLHLHIIGKQGAERMQNHQLPIETDFDFRIDPPTYKRAGELSNQIRRSYLAGEFDEIYFIFTQLERGGRMEVQKIRVLPADYGQLTSVYSGHEVIEGMDEQVEMEQIEYYPNVQRVLSYLFDTYLNGMLYGALTEAYASEQTARMTAMDSATDSANQMLQSLQIEANRARQEQITNELSEIVSGAEALAKKQ